MAFDFWRFHMRALIITLVITMTFAASARADVDVIRTGYENPALVIAKSTLYGAGAGLCVGLAVAVAVEDHEKEILRWSFVGGTLGGFLLGVVHVATRPDATTSLLEVDAGGLALGVPAPEFRVQKIEGESDLQTRVTLVSIGF